MNSLDKQIISFDCPECGRKLNKSIGWFRLNRQIACACGQAVKPDEKFWSQVAKMEKSFADLQRKLGKGFKLKLK